MKFSLILTTFDRQDDLDRFATYLSRQSFSGEIEVNFIAQGPADLIVPKSKAHIRVNRHQTIGPIPLSVARNLGMNDISGDVVAFPDDDCWYGPALLERISEFFCENPGLDGISIRVFDPIRKKGYGHRPEDSSRDISFSNIFVLPISVGIFVRRLALQRAGAYFDENLGAGTELGSGEETELLTRLLRAGCRIRYVGNLQVFHPVPAYDVSDIQKFRRYGVGFGYLNGRLLRDGHPGVLGEFLNVLVRSLGGALLKFANPVLRRLYWNRLTGILEGFVKAFARTGRGSGGKNVTLRSEEISR